LNITIEGHCLPPYAVAVAPVSTLIQFDPSENTKLPVPLPDVSDAFNAFVQKMIRPVLAEAVGRLANAIPVDVKPLSEVTGPLKVVFAILNLHGCIDLVT